MPLSPPGFSPPAWPRLGAGRGDTGLSTGLPPVPVEIPLCWLSGPVRLRLERPFTTAEVTRVGHGTTVAGNPAARTRRGDLRFPATLDTACSADAANLAHFTVTHRSEPRTRSPELVINLLIRTPEERVRILAIERNQRIRLTGVPPEYPEGAADLIVSGITDEIGVMARRVRLATRAGLAGPWLRVGHSAVGGSHMIPF